MLPLRSQAYGPLQKKRRKMTCKNKIANRPLQIQSLVTGLRMLFAKLVRHFLEFFFSKFGAHRNLAIFSRPQKGGFFFQRERKIGTWNEAPFRVAKTHFFPAELEKKEGGHESFSLNHYDAWNSLFFLACLARVAFYGSKPENLSSPKKKLAALDLFPASFCPPALGLSTMYLGNNRSWCYADKEAKKIDVTLFRILTTRLKVRLKLALPLSTPTTVLNKYTVAGNKSIKVAVKFALHPKRSRILSSE